ncbi:MAG TPA: arsenate reductase ArsC [Thermoanaerobaculia bacterium]|nr:arsenate reductase ArsC [Thermoanaerobaculia bacterium]
MGKPAILILCTGNSARSQMAEAILERAVGDRFDVLSAGTEPAERVHPLAVEVMAEQGYDLSGKRPKHLREYLGIAPVRTVIIVCDGAAKTCPAIWPGAHERLMWPFPDPAAVGGDEEAQRLAFRQVRDGIAEQTRTWVAAHVAAVR